MPQVKRTTSQSSPQSPSYGASGRWFGWEPRVVGGLALLMFAFPVLVTIWNLYRHTDLILQDSIQRQLLGTARSVAHQVDPVLHQTFTSPVQEHSDAYIAQIARMTNEKNALDTNGMIKFVYTCIEVDGTVRFVLDTSPSGDADHDGKDDKAHIMEIYEAPSDSLLAVLRTGVAAVDRTPYKDRWGTFMSAYAPVFDANRKLVAAAGVDIALTDYDLQRSEVRNVALVGALGAICLSYVGALGVAFYHRKLKTSVDQLVAAGESAMAAARTKSDFLAAMSHELRTPLNAVIGMTELLRDTKLDETQQSFVGTIQKSGESLLGTMTDILDFSQLDAGRVGVNPVSCSLSAMTRELKAHFQSQLNDKSLSFSVTVAASCPDRMMIDPGHVRQVLRHLIKNAIKFTEAGAITVHIELHGGMLSFQVSDTGIGIAPEQQKQLFQPFSQADGTSTRRHGGTGIGLAICKSLCDAMAGRIWAESEFGKGSVFQFEVPAKPAADQPSKATNREALLWCPDTMSQLLVTRVLEKLGHRAQTVGSLEELMQKESANSATWLLADAAVLTGEVQEKLRAVRNRMQVIVLNAEPGAFAASDYDAILPQPVRPADLKHVLEI